MSSKITIRVKSDVSQTQLNNDIMASGGRNQAQKLKNFLSGAESGAGKALLELTAQASATGTATVGSSGAQSFTINGGTLTGGTDYTISGLSASTVATGLAAAINASTDPNVQLVTASAAGAVVLVTARADGLVGNLIPISGTGAITASAATLAGGASGALTIHQYNIAKSSVA